MVFLKYHLLGTVKLIGENETPYLQLNFIYNCVCVSSFYIFLSSFNIRRLKLQEWGNEVKGECDEC